MLGVRKWIFETVIYKKTDITQVKITALENIKLVLKTTNKKLFLK